MDARIARGVAVAPRLGERVAIEDVQAPATAAAKHPIRGRHEKLFVIDLHRSNVVAKRRGDCGEHRAIGGTTNDDVAPVADVQPSAVSREQARQSGQRALHRIPLLTVGAEPALAGGVEAIDRPDRSNRRA